MLWNDATGWYFPTPALAGGWLDECEQGLRPRGGFKNNECRYLGQFFGRNVANRRQPFPCPYPNASPLGRQDDLQLRAIVIVHLHNPFVISKE